MVCVINFFFLGFLESPISLNVTVGERAFFQCRHSSADTLAWTINGTAVKALAGLSNLNSSDNITFLGDSSILAVLNIAALSEYNSSIVECVALFEGSLPTENSQQALLLLQGLYLASLSLYTD